MPFDIFNGKEQLSFDLRLHLSRPAEALHVRSRVTQAAWISMAINCLTM